MKVTGNEKEGEKRLKDEREREKHRVMVVFS